MQTNPLESHVGKIKFKSPILAASGTWAYGTELLDHPVHQVLAGFVTKSLSVQPSLGNLTPRIYETDGGMLNSIGLQNIGIDAFLKDVDPLLKKKKAPYILSIYANREEDFEKLAEKTKNSSAIAVELNISCPNIDKGGLEFSSDPKTTERLVKTVKQKCSIPLWVKLSPNVTDISEIGVAAETGGADALSMINTLVGMSINIDTGKPWLPRQTGGLSGPAIRPVAVEKVFRTYKKVKIPIVGMGGITSGRDILEFMMAGASAVQVGTWNFRDPSAPLKMVSDLEAYLKKRGFNSIRDIVGLAHRVAK